jgi:hypothetical protein
VEPQEEGEEITLMKMMMMMMNCADLNTEN